MFAQKDSNENPTASEASYQFGAFALLPRERLLTRHGQPVPLAPKSFDALLCLVRNAEHLVSKTELMDTLWPATYVCEANLTNTIVNLRRVLGRDAIQTVSKYGYRFVVPVHGVPGIGRRTYEMFARAKELTVQRSLESMTRARELYWMCIAEEPGFALAWAWLGRCCWFLGKFSGNAGSNRELADAALQRASAIDPDLACAHQFYTVVETDMGQARRALLRLRQRILSHPVEPESYAGLVQVLRFCGLIEESMEAHRRATDLDPSIVTSAPHTLFLAGDYMGTIETYSGRAGYYLDAAAWAALNEHARACALLQSRLARTPLSEWMAGLMGSLLALVEKRFDDALRQMEAMRVEHEPEVLVYLARHYSYTGASDSAVRMLRQALEGGFVCAPSTLRTDAWFSAVRDHPAFPSLLVEAEHSVEGVRAEFGSFQ